MRLADIPRVALAHLPTPLEYLPRLSEFLGGPRIYIKRDDQTGLALGGNKVRKLEFLVADALEQGCDTLVTTGGPQSNHARQTAAAAAKLGLACHLVLPKLVPIATHEYENSGNVLLDRLLGASVEMPAAADFSAATIEWALASLRGQGRRPYSIPIGGSTAVGALGYVAALHELFEQANAQSLSIDAIVVATGSAGTHAGILAGLFQTGSSIPLHGFAVSATTADKVKLVGSLAGQVCERLEIPAADLAARIQVDDAFVGPGYGIPTDAMREAVNQTARFEGLLLDPVYTGKAMAGLFAAVRRGQFTGGQNVVFWHTGGAPGLFAYEAELTTSV